MLEIYIFNITFFYDFLSNKPTFSANYHQQVRSILALSQNLLQKYNTKLNAKQSSENIQTRVYFKSTIACIIFGNLKRFKTGSIHQR